MFKPSVLTRTTHACAPTSIPRSRLVHTIASTARTHATTSTRASLTRAFSTATTTSTGPSHSNLGLMSRARANRIPPAEPWRRHTSQDPQTPNVFTFFEKATSTWQYIVVDPKTSEAAIIDPVLDYDPASGAITTSTADGLVSFVEHNALKVVRVL